MGNWKKDRGGGATFDDAQTGTFEEKFKRFPGGGGQRGPWGGTELKDN